VSGDKGVLGEKDESKRLDLKIRPYLKLKKEKGKREGGKVGHPKTSGGKSLDGGGKAISGVRRGLPKGSRSRGQKIFLIR